MSRDVNAITAKRDIGTLRLRIPRVVKNARAISWEQLIILDAMFIRANVRASVMSREGIVTNVPNKHLDCLQAKMDVRNAIVMLVARLITIVTSLRDNVSVDHI